MTEDDRTGAPGPVPLIKQEAFDFSLRQAIVWRIFHKRHCFLAEEHKQMEQEMIPTIPQSEYFERIAKFQKRIKAAGLDACLVHGTESDFANVRYLTEYWPTFEQAGVFVPAEGKAVLLIGPESLKYAQGRSVVPELP